MYKVKSGPQTFQFEGDLLGESTSWRRGSFRWIEFKLYRSMGGTYILSRVGVSLVYHVAACPLVDRYGLQGQDVNTLSEDATPCIECHATTNAPYVFPEKYRNWALVTEEPEAILDALYKEDEGGVRYLTNVASRLLDSASENDAAIDMAYKVEYID